VQPGDVVIIMAYAVFSQEEAKAYEPVVVMVDEKNGIKEIRGRESHGEI
jgi:aspartate 1-decarboxylase